MCKTIQESRLKPQARPSTVYMSHTQQCSLKPLLQYIFDHIMLYHPTRFVLSPTYNIVCIFLLPYII